MTTVPTSSGSAGFYCHCLPLAFLSILYLAIPTAVGGPEPDVIFEGHSWRVACLTTSKDSKLLLSGDRGGTFILWDTARGRHLRKFKAHDQTLDCLALSDDGKWLATGDYDGDVRLWELGSGRRLCSVNVFPKANGIMGIAFLGQKKTLIVAGNNRQNNYYEGELQVLDMPSGRATRKLPWRGKSIWSFAIDINSNVLVTGGDDRNEDGVIAMWNAMTGEEKVTFTGHTHYVTALALSPDGRLLASASCMEEIVKLWDLKTHKCVKAVTAHKEGVDFLAFSPDGQYLGSSGVRAGEMKIWAVPELQCVWTCRREKLRMAKIAFSPDGSRLYVGTETENFSSMDPRPILGWDWKKLARTFEKRQR